MLDDAIVIEDFLITTVSFLFFKLHVTTNGISDANHLVQLVGDINVYFFEIIGVADYFKSLFNEVL